MKTLGCVEELRQTEQEAELNSPLLRGFHFANRLGHVAYYCTARSCINKDESSDDVVSEPAAPAEPREMCLMRVK